MSPSRSFVLKLEPLAGITIAKGAWASITLLQNRSSRLRKIRTKNEKETTEIQVYVFGQTETKASPVQGYNFVTAND